ncbi:MAG: DUF2934 domain-containing protein [Planctomycetota bacterium]
MARDDKTTGDGDMSNDKSSVLRGFLETGSDLDDLRNGDVVQRENAKSPTNLRNRRFIAESGVVFQPVHREYAQPARQGTCFPTAQDIASQNADWTYVEGFALVDQGFLGTEPFGYAIHHAWTLDANGVVFDPVHREHGAAYIGVAFNHEYVKQRCRHFEEIERGSPLLEDEAFDPNSAEWRHPSIPALHCPEGPVRRKWVAENAYFRWVAEKRQHGRDLEHWLAAEAEFADSHGAVKPPAQPRPSGV